MEISKKKRVAVAVMHRTSYARLRAILKAVQSHPQLELQIILGSHVFLHHLLFTLRHTDWQSLRRLLPWYLKANLRLLFRRKSEAENLQLLGRLVKRDSFTISAQLPLFFDGGDLKTMVKTVGAGLLALPKIFQRLKPDIVLVHADRFEMLSVATAASFMNIPVAHTQGGDVSGTIDEVVRHAITKLAHLHFPTTEKSRERLIRMGEDPNYIFMTGCPTIDTLKSLDLKVDQDIYERNGNGYGQRIDLAKPFLLALQHPVTTEYNLTYENMRKLLAAIEAVNLPTLLFWPNIDGGFDRASMAVREFIANNQLPGLTLYKSFNTEDFYRVLNAATVAVGNSSSFIREGSFLGTPAVVVGTRQWGRERANNVIEVGYQKEAIVTAIKKQVAHGRYPASHLYGDGRAGERIAEVLAKINPPIQKQFHE